jgi:hypothetical protein
MAMIVPALMEYHSKRSMHIKPEKEMAKIPHWLIACLMNKDGITSPNNYS